MTYDFHGSWDQNRAHHSSLNSKDNEKDDTMYIVRTRSIVSLLDRLMSDVGLCGEIFSKTGHATEQDDARHRYLRTWWHTSDALHRFQRWNWLCRLLRSKKDLLPLVIHRSICVDRVVCKLFAKRWKRRGTPNNWSRTSLVRTISRKRVSRMFEAWSTRYRAVKWTKCEEQAFIRIMFTGQLYQAEQSRRRRWFGHWTWMISKGSSAVKANSL